MAYTSKNTAYTSVPVNPAPETRRPLKSFSWTLRVVICVLITIIVASIIYSIQRYHKNSNHKNSGNLTESKFPTQGVISNDSTSEICSTKYCGEAAQFIRRHIDETVDPCENFYEFTCGSFMRNTQISDDYESTIGILEKQVAKIMADLLSASSPQKAVEPKAITNARRLFKSCMDEKDVKVTGPTMMRKLIETEFGGLPNTVGSSWQKSQFDLSTTLLKLNQYYTFPFFHVATILDENSTTPLRTIIHISAGLQFNADDETLDESIFKTSLKHFLRHLSLLPPNYHSMEDDEDDSSSSFDKQVNQYLLTSLSDDSSSDITTTVEQLSSTIQTNFDFSNYIRRLYRSANVTLMDDDIVMIHQISKIRNISSLLPKQTPETLQLYMMRYFVLSQAYYILKNFRDDLEKTNTSQLSALDDHSKSMRCANYVNKNMPYAVSKLYVDKYYNRHAQKESIEIVKNIRNAFIGIVNASTWMDTVSKKKTMEKVDHRIFPSLRRSSLTQAQALFEKVGYPQYLEGNNMTKLETMYVKYQFTSSLMRNIPLLLKIKSKINLQELREPIVRHEWLHYGPMSINAFYHPFLNDITVPIGILRPPIFHQDAPKYLNYGMIGSLVGHEIAHGFDELRRHTDADGNHYSLWSQETNDIFDRRSSCIVEQYNNYTIPAIGFSVNGTKTREENIADNDGLKNAFFAYQKWSKSHQISEKKLPGFRHYSAEQMLFISFGQLWCSKLSDDYAKALYGDDDHSPTQFRSIGSTSNFAEFDRAFGCRPGQGNSRVNKCRVW